MHNIVQLALNGDVRAAARLMRIIDDRAEGYESYMGEIWPQTGNAFIIGITGAPGTGKSTLTNRLIMSYRGIGKSVGIIAIDPTSPFSGGAILGDRIRMVSHINDNDVFIRSLATRGHLGGITASAYDIAAIMDAMGKDVIIIETVGVGQDEVEITSIADCCVVVTIPGLGDDIQAIKAGILEIADVFAINKADHEGADRSATDLEAMLSLSPISGWRPPVIKTVASSGEGISELKSAIDSYMTYSGKEKQNRKLLRALSAAKGIAKEKVATALSEDTRLKEILAETDCNPYAAVEILWPHM